MEKITLAHFNSMSDEDKNALVEALKSVYIDENVNAKQAKEKLNFSDNLFRHIISTYNIRKSRSLIIASSRKSYKERTGYDHPMQNPEVVEKLKQTNMNRYGGVGFQSEELAKKSNNTIQSRYGVYNYAKTKEFVERSKKTFLQNYGVDNPSKSEDIKDKIQAVQVNKYGCLYSQTDEYKKRVEQTCLERYGTRSAMHSDIIKQRLIDTNRKRFGVDWVVQSDQFKKKVSEILKCRGIYSFSSAHLPEESQKIIHDKDLFLDYILAIPKETRTINNIAKSLQVSDCRIGELVRYYELSDYVNFNSHRSSYEDEICQLLDSWGIEYECSRRDILDGYEIDIFISKFSLGIEFNGIYWHCDKFVSKNYHQMKTLLAQSKGIFLYHIFEYEWLNTDKRSIIISQLKVLLRKVSDVIYARNCNIISLPVDKAKTFLNENHIQGYRNATVRYALEYQGNPVCVMTFGKAYLSRQHNVWEIYRLCSLKNTVVVGGASRLYTYFLRQNKPDKVITFCDACKGKGNIYRELGFSFLDITSPNYVWVKGNIWKTRYQTQMKSEREIMENEGYLRIYDSGSFKYEVIYTD